jgi:hypothetical protein
VALSYNQEVENQRTSLKLPALLSAGSFLIILFCILFTNPVDKVGVAVIFFAALLILFSSLGYLIVGFQMGAVSPKNRSRIVISSVFLLILLMFRSAESLGWVDALVLLGITAGLLFYSSRRNR